MIYISFNFELISLKRSLNNRPSDSNDKDIETIREQIQSGLLSFNDEEKLDFFSEQEILTLKDSELGRKLYPQLKYANADHHFFEMDYDLIQKTIEDYIENQVKIIGFDESSKTCPKSSDYAKLLICKFGEGHISFKDGKYIREKIMYKPITAYIEDNDHKLMVYKEVIENFIDTLKKNFYVGELKTNIDEIYEWFEAHKKSINERIKTHSYHHPKLKHIVNRIRTSDEILKSLIRIKEESNGGKNKNLVFLGDGIHMFQHFEFPPKAFTKFFYNFIQKYNINYYSISKKCLLRDTSGRFILPSWEMTILDSPFIVRIPHILHYTKSNTFISRLQESARALRFDIPDNLSMNDAINIIENLRAFSPQGYPICLKDAHFASELLPSENNKFMTEFYEMKYNDNTKKFYQSLRDRFLKKK